MNPIIGVFITAFPKNEKLGRDRIAAAAAELVELNTYAIIFSIGRA
jgi:hypothetical protein